MDVTHSTTRKTDGLFQISITSFDFLKLNNRQINLKVPKAENVYFSGLYLNFERYAAETYKKRFIFCLQYLPQLTIDT